MDTTGRIDFAKRREYASAHAGTKRRRGPAQGRRLTEYDALRDAIGRYVLRRARRQNICHKESEQACK